MEDYNSPELKGPTITLKINGVVLCYNLDALYHWLLKDIREPTSQIPFTKYQLRVITELYRAYLDEKAAPLTIARGQQEAVNRRQEWLEDIIADLEDEEAAELPLPGQQRAAQGQREAQNRQGQREQDQQVQQRTTGKSNGQENQTTIT